MGKGGSVSVKERNAMSEDAPVNTGAATVWPDPDSAYFAVRRMQIKLHRWASEEPARRFGDLYNLVYDPAFLVHAWERVRSNAGSGTPGIDRATVAMDRDPDRGRCFPGPHTALAEIRRVPPGGSAAGADTEERPREVPEARYSHGRGPGGPGKPEGSARTHFRGGFQAVLVRVSPQPAAARRDRRDPTLRPPEDTSGCWRRTSKPVSTKFRIRR